MSHEERPSATAGVDQPSTVSRAERPRRNPRLSSILIAMLVAFALGTDDPAPAYVQGRMLRDQGRYTAAVERFIVLAERPPASTAFVGDPRLDSQIQLGLTYYDWRRWPQAIQLLRAALAEDPSSLTARRALASALQESDRWSESEVEWQKVLDLSPDAPDALYGLGLAALRAGDAERARAQFERLATTPAANGSPLWKARSAYYVGLLRLTEDAGAAVGHLRIAAVGDDPEIAPKARSLLKAIDESSSQSPGRRLTDVGQSCLAVGEPVVAAFVLGEAVDRSDAPAEARVLLGGAQALSARPEDALATLASAADEPLSHYFRGIALRETGDLPAAIGELKRAVDLDPANPDLRSTLATTYLQAQRIPQAEEQLTLAARLAPNKPEPAIALARFYVDRALFPSLALIVAESATSVAPDNAEAAELHGRALLMNGRNAKGLTVLRRSTELDPRSPSARYWLAQALMREGRRFEARQEVVRAADLDPTSRFSLVLGRELKQLETLPPIATPSPTPNTRIPN